MRHSRILACLASTTDQIVANTILGTVVGVVPDDAVAHKQGKVVAQHIVVVA